MKKYLLLLIIGLVFLSSTNVIAYECTEDAIEEYVFDEYGVNNDSKVNVYEGRFLELYDIKLFSSEVHITENEIIKEKISIYVICDTAEKSLKQGASEVYALKLTTNSAAPGTSIYKLKIMSGETEYTSKMFFVKIT